MHRFPIKNNRKYDCQVYYIYDLYLTITQACNVAKRNNNNREGIKILTI